jgi:hypothetical protein
MHVLTIIPATLAAAAVAATATACVCYRLKVEVVRCKQWLAKAASMVCIAINLYIVYTACTAKSTLNTYNGGAASY